MEDWIGNMNVFERSAMDLRKQAFWEIGGGRLGLRIQTEFEEASILACETNQEVEVTAKIKIKPPREQNIGGISYSVYHSTPKYKSIEFEAEFDHGLIIATARPDVGVLQQGLEFPEITNKQQEAANGK